MGRFGYLKRVPTRRFINCIILAYMVTLLFCWFTMFTSDPNLFNSTFYFPFCSAIVNENTRVHLDSAVLISLGMQYARYSMIILTVTPLYVPARFVYLETIRIYN